VKAARDSGRPVVVDAAGDALLAALRQGVDAVKPNRPELEGIAGRALSSFDDVVEAARRLIALGTSLVVVSLGHEGSLAVTADEAWFAPPLEVEVVNPAGAGDGMTAMLALGLAERWAVPEILQRGAAVATAIVTTEGTAECPPAVVDHLLPQVRIVRRQ
jgi:fructose-1-phosphate kinase PfkB-like protein